MSFPETERRSPRRRAMTSPDKLRLIFPVPERPSFEQSSVRGPEVAVAAFGVIASQPTAGQKRPAPSGTCRGCLRTARLSTTPSSCCKNRPLRSAPPLRGRATIYTEPEPPQSSAENTQMAGKAGAATELRVGCCEMRRAGPGSTSPRC